MLLACALGLILVLAAGVGNVQLSPGRTLGPMAMPAFSRGGAPQMDGTGLITLFRIVMALLIAMIPVVIIGAIFSKSIRNQLFKSLLVLGVMLLAVTLLRDLKPPPFIEAAANAIAAQEAAAETGANAVPDFVFTPDQAALQTIVLALAALLVIGGLAMLSLWWVIRNRRNPPAALKAIADEAQTAIDALRTGAALDETIVRCYRDMCEVLQRERGLARAQTMTASEFERSLQNKGVPHDAVRQLTRLFEDIRYGAAVSGEREKTLAIDSLSRIAAACGGAL